MLSGWLPRIRVGINELLVAGNLGQLDMRQLTFIVGFHADLDGSDVWLLRCWGAKLTCNKVVVTPDISEFAKGVAKPPTEELRKEGGNSSGSKHFSL